MTEHRSLKPASGMQRSWDCKGAGTARASVCQQAGEAAINLLFDPTKAPRPSSRTSGLRFDIGDAGIGKKSLSHGFRSQSKPFRGLR